MNKVLIVDASSSDPRIMAGLLTKAGYDPVTAEDFDAAKEEVAKLPPGAVVVTALHFTREVDLPDHCRSGQHQRHRHYRDNAWRRSS